MACQPIWSYFYAWRLGLVWFHGHLNRFRLFNSKSILIHINSSIPNNLVHSLNVKNTSISNNSVQHEYNSLVLFDPQIGPYPMLATPGQGGPRTNGNKWILRIPQRSSITGASPSDAVQCHILDTRQAEGVLLFCRDEVGVFLHSQPTGPAWRLENHVNCSFITSFFVYLFKHFF